MPIDDDNSTKLTNEQQYDAKLAALRAAIDEGEASGVAEGDVLPASGKHSRNVKTMRMKNPPHPGGFVLRQCIEPMGLSITQAAAALGVTRTTLSELVNEKRGISPEMAVRLSQVFASSAESWLVQQAQYDLAQVRTDRLKLKRLEFA